jgi:hypothetical protein
MSRLSCPRPAAGFRALLIALVACSVSLGGELVTRSGAADPSLAAGVTVDVVATRIPRPVQLAFSAAGTLVVLSHGWRGDAAGEIFWLNLGGALPVDASRAPRLVIPFSEEPRKAAFGSLALHPSLADIFLGEENGNRIYRLTEEKKLTPLAVGLHHLVGGGGIVFDPEGRLVALDFVSTDTQLRSETTPPPTLYWLAGEGYQGPLVFRIDPREGPQPRRLDLMAPLFPRGWGRAGVARSLPRFIAVTATPGGDLVLLDSLGELRRLTPEGHLVSITRLPAGHYHRTNMAVTPDGSIVVSSGFHIRHLYGVSPAGAVTTIARDLGDPAGVAVDRSGAIYLAEAAHHRIVRIRPTR